MTTNITAATYLLSSHFYHTFVNLGSPSYNIRIRDSIKAYQQEHNLPDTTTIRELINHAYGTVLQDLDSIPRDNSKTYWDTYTTVLLNSAAQYIVQKHPNCEYYATNCDPLHHTSLFTVLSIFQKDGLHAYVSVSRSLCRNTITEQDFYSRIKTWCTQWAISHTHITLVTSENEAEELLEMMPERIGVLAATPGHGDGYRMVREPQRYDKLLAWHKFYDQANMSGGFAENFGLRRTLKTTVGEVWDVLDPQPLDDLISVYYQQEIMGAFFRDREVERHTALADGIVPVGWGAHVIAPNMVFNMFKNIQKPISEYTSYELKEGGLYF
jgi:hypothetical protein